MSFKVIRDPIYGYISIPTKYIANFVDNQIFQRLRRIEQTSMRALYPSAHHDRFAHSLGVYYLGQLAFSNLKKNSFEFLKDYDLNWELIQNSFEIACLLHDCGHSPFSHTFEHYYVFGQEGQNVSQRLNSFFSTDPSFSQDIKKASPAPHEKISALVVLEKFYDAIEDVGGNPKLVARMIMGVQYRKNRDFEEAFFNCFIRLLNGAVIDVDSLDYIQRDSWASGVNNVSIDYERLLRALIINIDERDLPVMGFKKHVVSVLENISIGRNFLYRWIYSHHKITYDQHLLIESIELIDKKT